LEVPELAASGTEEKLIRRYLLGDLSDAETGAVESRYLTDDALYEDLEIAEEQLIDSYVAGELSGSERRQFQRLFRSPSRRARVELARILFRRNSSQSNPLPSTVQEKASSWANHLLNSWRGRSPLVKLAMGTASALLFVGVSLMAIKALKQRPGISSHSAVSFELVTSDVRGGSSLPTLVIPGGAEQVELKLFLEGGKYTTYQATLKTASGDAIWQEGSLEPTNTGHAIFISVTLPARLLSAGGSFVILLESGIENVPHRIVGEYAFKVGRG
jgi:hypothetical protein